MLPILLQACAPDAEESVVDAGMELGEVATCDGGAAEPSWTESGAGWELLPPPHPGENHEEGPAIAAGDLDGDGLDDLAVVHQLGNNAAYLNRGATGTRVDLGVNVALGVVLLDLDADGDLDVLTGGEAPQLLESEGGAFLAARPLLAMPNPEANPHPLTHDLAHGDLDGDGQTDLYLPMSYSYGDEENRVNDVVMWGEDGGFRSDETAVPLEPGQRHSMDALLFDEDADGDLDAYVVNDFGSVTGPSTLLRYDGGTFTDAGEDCYCELLSNAKGVDVADVDRDGQPDLYVSANPSNALLLRRDGGWVDAAQAMQALAVDTNATGWGGLWVDLENDGWLDLLVAQGDRWNDHNDHVHVDVPLKLLRQEDGVFTDVAPAYGLDVLGSYRAAVATDLNRDGVLDFAVTAMDTAPLLFLSDGCTSAGWLEVEAPVGSRVVV